MITGVKDNVFIKRLKIIDVVNLLRKLKITKKIRNYNFK